MPSTYQTYGTRRQQHWSKCALFCRLGLLFIALAFVFFYIYGIIFVPFMDAREIHVKSVREANAYLKSQVCTNKAVQDELAEFGLLKCGQSYEIANKDVNKAAVNDVLRSLNLCKDGECVVMSFNIVTFSIVAVIAALIIIVLTIVITVCWIVHSLYQLMQSSVEIPFVNEKPANIAMRALASFASQQQQTTEKEHSQCNKPHTE